MSLAFPTVVLPFPFLPSQNPFSKIQIWYSHLAIKLTLSSPFDKVTVLKHFSLFNFFFFHGGGGQALEGAVQGSGGFPIPEGF